MKVALIQITSVLDPNQNLEKIENYLSEIKAQNEIDAVFLPEVFYSMSNGKEPTPYLVEGKNEHFKNIQNLAKKFNVYLLGGSAATLKDGKVYNTTYNFSPTGILLSYYDKIHLFAVNLRGKENSTVIDEGKVYSSGNELNTLDINEFKLGTSICFDLRFPELYREYFKQGVNLLSISSAFTVPTGKAHWKTLVKARAIENQSYVIACDQVGKNNETIKTYGHSLIVDPWGEVIGELGEEEGYLIAKLDIEHVRKIRARMNVAPRV